MHYTLKVYAETQDNHLVGTVKRFPEVPSNDQIKQAIIEQLTDGTLHLEEPQCYYTRVWRVARRAPLGRGRTTITSGRLRLRKGTDGQAAFF